MKLSHLVLAELCWPFLANALHIPRTDESAVSNLTSSAYSNGLSTVEEREIQLDARHDKSKCTLKNLAIRREYGSLSRNERLDYVNAVLCLQSLPPRTPANVSSIQVRRLHRRPHSADSRHPLLRRLPTLAPLVRPLLRESSPRRMRLQGLPALLGLAKVRSRASRLANL
jgi:hypothetical protein